MNSKRISVLLLCTFIGNNLLALDPFETKEGLKAMLLVYPFFIIPGMLLNLFKSTPQPGLTLREALQNMFPSRPFGTYTPTLYYEFSSELENIIKALEDPSKIDTYYLTEYKNVKKIDSIKDFKQIPHLKELTRQAILSDYTSPAFDALKLFHQIVNTLLERTRLQNIPWWQRLYLRFKEQVSIQQQIKDLNYALTNRLAMLNEFLHLPIKEEFLTPSAENQFNEFYAKFSQTQS